MTSSAGNISTMLAFKFIFRAARPLSPFELGDLEIISDDKVVFSSCGQSPNQSMMLFIDLYNLLDGVRSLQREHQFFSFVGTDSSFHLQFQRERAQILIVGDKNTVKSELRPFCEALYAAVMKLRAEYVIEFAADNSVMHDLQRSIEAFKSYLYSLRSPSTR